MRLFFLLTGAGGVGGFLGSVAGGAVGRRALFVGAVLGGLFASAGAAYVQTRLG